MYNMKYVRGVLPLMLVLIMEFNGGAYSNSQTHVCTRYSRGSDHGTRSTQTSDKYQRGCGFWGWGRCTTYRAKYRTAYITTYKTVPIQECCSGWQNMQGGRCRTPICNPRCENGGSCVAPNSCQCPPNFTGRKCEAVITPSGCDRYNGGCSYTCVTSGDHFHCTCPTGHQLASNGRSCVDVNECEESTSGCHQLCENSVGSYSCSCRQGYTLGDDGKSCSLIDHCQNRHCERFCVNVPGRAICYCDIGEYLTEDGQSCAVRNNI
ncbi:growth arrest-specific protein 6-like [Ptychodera flava]|uniref:growth arrest-specific protein 6-like n=1 Tax=Ptychodera flava TaxID=63121 RepID=UPI00396A9CF1